MNNNENFATKFGRFIGNMLFLCLSACVASVVIALAVRFIVWLF